MAKMITCKSCGAEMDASAKNCPKCGAKVKKPFYKQVWFWIVVVVVVIALASGGNDDKTSTTDNTKTADNTAQESVTETKTETDDASVEETETEVEETVSKEYQNAYKKAESYYSKMHMSKAAVYDQLTSEYGEGFPEDAAQYAVDKLDETADWNDAALQKAISYQEDMAMSKSAIYDQLTSEYGEQFTAEQAQYAIDNLPE